MRSIYVLTVCLFYLCTANAKTTTTEISLRFDTDIDQLDPANQMKLKAFLSSFSVDDDLTIIVCGHADKRGTNSYNLDLSKRRAAAVTSVLTGEGFCDIGIVTEAFGEQKPIDGDHSKLSDNRRVDVIIQKHQIESKQELLEILGANNDVVHEIDLSTENVIKSERGTVIGIPSNCFLDVDGLPVENATVSIIEALSYADFLAEGLTTMSDGKMLVSGGMLKIEAFSSTGDTLTLDPTKPIVVSLPTKLQQPGMSLFVSNNGSNWSNTGTKPVNVSVKYPERPVFKGDVSYISTYHAGREPVMPSIRKRPKLPRAVDDSKYELEFQWYEIVGRKKKIEQMLAAKKRDEARYERSMLRYSAKLDKFIADSLAQPEKHIAYQKAMTEWRLENTADSIDYMENVYKPKMREREIRLGQLYSEYDIKLSAWRDSCQKIRNQQLEKAISTGVWDIDLVRSYTFESTNLGWINCDRFYDEPEIAKINLRIDAPENNQVILVFEDLNSMLNCEPQQRGYMSPKIPRRKPAIAIAYSVIDGKIMLDQANYSGQTRIALNPQPVSLNEFREALHVNS